MYRRAQHLFAQGDCLRRPKRGAGQCMWRFLAGLTLKADLVRGPVAREGGNRRGSGGGTRLRSMAPALDQ